MFKKREVVIAQIYTGRRIIKVPCRNQNFAAKEELEHKLIYIFFQKIIQFEALSKLAQLKRIIDGDHWGLWTKPQLLRDFCNFFQN